MDVKTTQDLVNYHRGRYAALGFVESFVAETFPAQFAEACARADAEEAEKDKPGASE